MRLQLACVLLLAAAHIVVNASSDTSTWSTREKAWERAMMAAQKAASAAHIAAQAADEAYHEAQAAWRIAVEANNHSSSQNNSNSRISIRDEDAGAAGTSTTTSNTTNDTSVAASRRGITLVRDLLSPASTAEHGSYYEDSLKLKRYRSIVDVSGKRRLEILQPVSMQTIESSDLEVLWAASGFGEGEEANYYFNVSIAHYPPYKIPFKGNDKPHSVSMTAVWKTREAVRVTMHDAIDNSLVLVAFTTFVTTPAATTSPSGCTTAFLQGDVHQFQNPSAYRGHWLRTNGLQSEAMACLLDAVQYAANAEHKFFMFPLLELWRAFQGVGDARNSFGVIRTLRRLFRGFVMPATRWDARGRKPRLDLDLRALSTVDLTPVAHLLCAYSGQYIRLKGGFDENGMGGAMGEHYRFLSYLSKQLGPNALIYDLGTRHGASALALASHAPTNKIISYDVSTAGLQENFESCGLIAGEFFSMVPSNIEFRNGNVVEDDPQGLLAADLIVLDTEHDGPFEAEVYEFLKANGFRGLLVCDDLYVYNAMEAFWSRITEPKIDVTANAHWSGTGVVDFGGGNSVRLIQPASF